MHRPRQRDLGDVLLAGTGGGLFTPELKPIGDKAQYQYWHHAPVPAAHGKLYLSVTPENFAATIYDALAIPHNAEWHDTTGRPYAVYMAEPIRGLRG